MLTEGEPVPNRPAVQVIRVGVDINVQVPYKDGQGMDGVGYFRYRTTFHDPWPTWTLRLGTLSYESRSQI